MSTTFANCFGAGTLLLVLATSALLYDHRGRRYSEGKSQSIESPASFALVYRYIQLTTALFGFASFGLRHPALLRMHDEPWFVIAGSVVALAGLAVFVAAKRTLGRSYSPCFDSLVPQTVVRRGVYRAVRHPIYTANFLIVGGLALATGSAWLVLNLLLLVVYYTRAAKTEEAALAREFGEYRSYMQHSGRFFPRLGLLSFPSSTGRAPRGQEAR